MVFDFANMSTLDLRELIARANSALIARQQEDKNEARAQINEIAKNLGVPVKELVAGMIAKPAKAVAPRYRNPANANETWTGRGRAPRWAQPYVAAGTLDTTLIVQPSAQE